MAARKPIIDIAIDDGKFRAFKELFDKYQEEVKKQPGLWSSTGEVLQEMENTFEGILEEVTKITEEIEKAREAERKQGAEARGVDTVYRGIARSTHAISTSVRDTTISLAKWTGIGGIITGVLGAAGGLFGVGHLMASAGASRRSAMGLGLSVGEQASFGTNFDRAVDTGGFLSGVNEALHDVTKRVGLYGAGLSDQEMRGSTGEVASQVLTHLKRIADSTDPALLGNVVSARHLDQFVSLQDLERLRAMSPQEFSQLQRRYSGDQRSLGFDDQTAKAWQDLSTEMSRAGGQIEATFVRGLVPLTPGFEKVADATAKVIDAFLRSPALAKWLGELSDGLEKFAGWIGSDDFQKKIESFVTNVASLGIAIVSALDWISKRTGIDTRAATAAGVPSELMGRGEGNVPTTAGQAKANYWLNRGWDAIFGAPDPTRSNGGGMTGLRAGRMSAADAADLIRKAGGTEEEAVMLGAIAAGESGGNPRAHNKNLATGDDSYGLWQVNMLGSMGPQRLAKYGLNSNEDLLDPLTNAKVALKMEREAGGYGDWSVYKSGAYARYLNAARGPSSQSSKWDGINTNPPTTVVIKNQTGNGVATQSNQAAQVPF